jgi:hypothetical protein
MPGEWGKLLGLDREERSQPTRGSRTPSSRRPTRTLRGACEIVVEQDLLQRVVQRYSPNVMVGNLRGIRVAELPAAIGTINDVFERRCRFIG